MEDRGGERDSLGFGGQRKSGAPEQAARVGDSRPREGHTWPWDPFLLVAAWANA